MSSPSNSPDQSNVPHTQSGKSGNFIVALRDLTIWSTPGIVGALCNTYVGHPFDTVRVRMQDISSPYKTATQCLRTTITNEGYKGLFKGSTSSLYASMAENSVVFGVNEVIKRKFYDSGTKSSLSLGQDMMIGSISGFAATIAACPLETIKCNMQINNSNCVTKHRSIIEISKELKFSGLYNGFNASCARNIPYYLLFFPLYSRYIKMISDVTKRQKRDQNVLDYAIAGGLSGATTWSIVYPFDVIKCNQQIHRTKIDMMSMSRLLYNTKGIKSFYAGFRPTIVRAFFANTALLFGVEAMNQILGIGC